MTDAIDVRKKRAIYRSAHRGTKELDIVLGRYAFASLDGMTDEQLSEFERLLALPDPDIDAYLRGQPTPDGIASLILSIRKHAGFCSKS